MSPREKLHRAYALAFRPDQLNAAWNDWEKGTGTPVNELREIVAWALTLQQPLPEAPEVSTRALLRVARYQAISRVYRLPSMLRRFHQKLGGTTAIPRQAPAWMVRDVGLPPFGPHVRAKSKPNPEFRKAT
jgi:hypothetical protein